MVAVAEAAAGPIRAVVVVGTVVRSTPSGRGGPRIRGASMKASSSQVPYKRTATMLLSMALSVWSGVSVPSSCTYASRSSGLSYTAIDSFSRRLQY